MSMTGWFAGHRGATVGFVMAAVAAVAFGIYWFAPQRLFIDQRVSESLPAGSAASSEEGIRLGQANRGGASEQGSREPASEGGAGEPDEPTVLAEGVFRSLEHASSGRALVLQLPDGRRFLRFEDLDTSNGPDLRVYLSAAAATSGLTEFGEEFVDLGALKGNQGIRTTRSRQASRSTGSRAPSSGAAASPWGSQPRRSSSWWRSGGLGADAGREQHKDQRCDGEPVHHEDKEVLSL